MIHPLLSEYLYFQRTTVEQLLHNKWGPWLTPQKITSVGKTNVDIWFLKIPSISSSGFVKLESVLSASEIVRSKKFHLSEARFNYICSKGILRLILAEYIKVRPSEIEFCFGVNGKPALFHANDKPSLLFNLSHSKDMALFAITRIGEIGVDVERISIIEYQDKIVNRFFSIQEQIEWSNMAPQHKVSSFFSCWTRKEAFLKGLGSGLSLSLDQFSVSIVPDQPAKLLSVNWEATEMLNWLLADIPIGNNYSATLAVNIAKINQLF